MKRNQARDGLGFGYLYVVDARGAGAEFHADPITDAKQVKSVVEKFRAKYGAGDVKKYYSKLDVAVLVQLP